MAGPQDGISPASAAKPLNVTSLQTANSKTEIAEEKFRHLVESVKDYGIFMLDPQGKIESWNEGAARMNGYAASEVIGKNFSIFYSREERERRHPQEELEIADRDGRYEEEGWRVRKDGSTFWANIVITRLANPAGDLIGFSKVTRDLTERKKAEDALLASEERARLIYESVRDYAIISLDPRGIVTSWNEGARRIKGYEADEIVGKHFSAFYLPEDIESGKCEYELREAAITGRFEDESLRVRKDGTKFWANVVITALYDRQRKLCGYSKVTRDVTERKRGEDRLKMANEQLERRVEERTAALSVANEALRQAVAARDEFLNIASHELRTPITPLKLQLQMILAHLRKGTLATLTPERLESVAAAVDRSLFRIGKLIDSLLDVTRINGGKIDLHPERLLVDEVIQEIVERLHVEATSAGSALSYRVEPATVAFFDRTRLDQIVTNLVSNSIRYGNGKPVHVSAQISQANLIIRVKDQGIGIAKENHSRIFNRFDQVTRIPGSVGMGLGLYITKQIVDAHGGAIAIESALGSGSVFTVTLPLGPAPRGGPA